MKHFPARFILASRWLMAPLYIGLIASFLLLLVRFFRKLYDLFAHAPTQSTNEVIVGILSGGAFPRRESPHHGDLLGL